jgi:N-acetylglucosaminyl-diphospho-decaprenol L-rhamnosyltransferase
VVVVDNGSSDGTVDLVRSVTGVTLVEERNGGYSAGLNRGFREVPDGHDFLILNADVVLEPGSIDRLAAVLAGDDDVAIAVPMLRDASGALLPSLRRSMAWWRTLAEALVGGNRAGRLGEAYEPDPRGGPQEAEWATGAAMLLRREIADELGPWDESFFLYSEETEYCLRARDRGYKVVCQPTAVMTHVGGEMGRDARVWTLRAVNRIRLQRRRGRLGAAALRATSVLFESRRAALGDPVSRAALKALLSRDLDGVAEELVASLGGETVQIRQ